MFTAKIQELIDFCNAHEVNHWENAAIEKDLPVDFYKDFICTYEVEKARKYIKIYRRSKTSASIFMFLDQEGNIYKPASCKAPAKHARGHISEWKKSLTIRSSVISVNYMRGY